MKRYRYIDKLLVTVAMIMGFTIPGNAQINTENVNIIRKGDKMMVSAEIVLDSLDLKSNRQIFLTPVIEGKSGESAQLPSILVTGRGMHYAYERGTMRGLSEFRKKYNIMREIRRDNGKNQTVDYLGSTLFRPWMRTDSISLKFRYDSCGCGVQSGTEFGNGIDTTLNPVGRMRLVYVTPRVTDLPVSIHEGKARVQFEVNRTELHDLPYTCRNGQRIDNREQLKVILDSIEYAVTDPNVTISGIQITGFASPESPYEHNLMLATGRSRALSDYIAQYVGRKYNLGKEIASFDVVPENWGEFREMTISSKELTETQRNDLLELIDRPAFTAADYDAKEKILKTDHRFRDLYRNLILPEWFPLLRATKFRISTKLKPMSDQELAHVLEVTPEKMSLNQMMRVANLHPQGSKEFDAVIETALQYYPDDEEANLNAAVTAIRNGKYNKAETLLRKSGDSPEAQNARAVILAIKGDFDGAREILKNISGLSEAETNLLLLSDE